MARTYRKIMGFFGVRPGEGLRVGLMFAYFFLVITSYYVIKPVRNSLFIERLGADNLPYVYIATALFVGVIISFYSRFADRVGRQALVLGTFAFLASNLVVFWWLLRGGTLLTSGAFYLWAKLYPLLLVSQFWLVANELFTTPQAKRVFGFVGAGGIIGGIAGSTIAGTFATLVGSERLLLVSVGILALCAMLVMVIGRVTEPVRQRPVTAEERKARGAWSLLKESTHLRTIAYILGLTIIVSTVVDWQFNKAIELFIPGEDAKTAFFGRFFAVLNIASVLIQLLLTSWILRVFGLGVALVLLPIGLLTGSLGIIIHPGFWTAVFAKGVEGSLRYSLDQSTRELLFLPLGQDVKYRGKPLIDMVVYRGGTGVAGVIVLVATSLLSFGLREMAILAAVLVAFWMGVTVAMRREFRASVKKLIRTRDVEPQELIIEHLDAATRGELREALEGDDEYAILYSISLLEGIEDEEISRRAERLLAHPSEGVRARTLRALFNSGYDRHLDVSQTLLEDPSLEVRAEAINFICHFGPLPASEAIEGFVESEEPEVRAAAVACLARQSEPEKARAAANLIGAMGERQAGTEAARERRLAAEVIGMLNGHVNFHDLLGRLLHDREPSVRKAAVRTAAIVCYPELLPDLISQLCCPDRRAEVKTALAAYGPAAYDQLAKSLQDPAAPYEVRRAIPSIFYEAVSQEGIDVLIALLPDLPPAVRHAVLKTLDRIRRNHEGYEFDEELLDEVLILEVRTGYQAAADRLAVPEDGLVGQVLEEAESDALERVSRVLGLIYPLPDVLAAYQGLTSGDEAMAAAGFELLDTILSVRHRRMIAPLADPELPREERVLRGTALVDAVKMESRDPALLRLTAQEDQPWVAMVAGAALGTPIVPRNLPEHAAAPYHVHVIPRTGKDLTALMTEDVDTMLKLVERADFLRDVEIFSEVRTEDLAKIAAIAREREYGANEVLFEEGDAGSELYLVISGGVEATRHGDVVFKAERGETVGTLALIDARPREFTAIATQSTRALVIQRDDFYDLMHDDFDLVEGLLVHLVRVVRLLNERADLEELEV